MSDLIFWDDDKGIRTLRHELHRAEAGGPTPRGRWLHGMPARQKANCRQAGPVNDRFLNADWFAGNPFMYYQMPIRRNARLSFNDQIGRCSPDGTLRVKMASF